MAAGRAMVWLRGFRNSGGIPESRIAFSWSDVDRTLFVWVGWICHTNKVGDLVPADFLSSLSGESAYASTESLRSPDIVQGDSIQFQLHRNYDTVM